MNKSISKITIALIISLLVIGILFAQEIGIIVVPNGNVGIGTENPTAALEVNGRIKDKTGFVMPVGTILAYGGDTAPEGWLLCDGLDISRTEYADLFVIIDITYGTGNGSTTFNIPDLRGIFLRGAGTNGQLTDANGNPFTATLGEYQNDSMQGHEHESGTPLENYMTTGAYGKINIGSTSAPSDKGGGTSAHRDYTSEPLTDGTNGTPRIGTETNPANVAVNYIIKY